MMMDLGMVIIFVLLQASLLNTGVNSSPSISTEELSNNKSANNDTNPSALTLLHQLHPRGAPSSVPAVPKEDQNMLDLQNYLEFVAVKAPPTNAVQVSDDKGTYYIVLSGKCEGLKLLKVSEATNQEQTYLVNKDDFEILEWKTWADTDRTLYPIITCKKHYIVRNEKGIECMSKDSLKKNMQIEVLTLNRDIKQQHLQIDNYEASKEEGSESLEVLKRFVALNKNCEPAKHQVKLDQGSDKSSSFLKGRSHTLGGAIEASVSGKFFSLVQIGGKLTGKYDHIRSHSVTTADINKVVHSVSTEIQVPPNQSCTIDVTSTTFTVDVPYSGQLIRQYNNNEERRTIINGIYTHQEVTELQAVVNTCTPLSDPTKCGKA